MNAILSRRDLIEALTEAVELEHSLTCLYLFAAYSIKRSLDEGLTPAQLARCTAWKSQLLIVARQEMAHMGAVNNLLTAIGGAPHLVRPNFPQVRHYFGDFDKLELLPFSPRTLDRFIRIEEPEQLQLQRIFLGGNSLTLPPSEPGTLPSLDDTWRDALALAGRTIGKACTWQYCEIWERDATRPGCWTLMTTYHVDPSNDCGDLERMASLAQQLSAAGGMTDAVGVVELAMSIGAKKRRSVGFGIDSSIGGGRALAALQLGLNTGTLFPIVWNGRVVAFVLFLFRTYLSTGEDDSTVTAMAGALSVFNDPESASGSLPNQVRNQVTALATPAESEGRLQFSTVGALYRAIRKAFGRLTSIKGPTGLFIGPPQTQITNKKLGFLPHWKNMDIYPVSDVQSAWAMIDLVIEQGEGTSGAGKDCHYERFLAIRREMDEFDLENPSSSALAPGASLQYWASRPVAGNPVVRVQPDQLESSDISLVTDPFSAALVDQFNQLYETLCIFLGIYGSAAGEGVADQKEMGGVIIEPIMTMVIRPLCEIITSLPIGPMPHGGDPRTGINAGPSFEFDIDYQILPYPKVTWTYLYERLGHAEVQLELMCARPEAPPRLATVVESLSYLVLRIKAYMDATLG